MTKVLVAMCFVLLVCVSASGFSRYPSKPKDIPIPPSGPSPRGYPCRATADCQQKCPCVVNEQHCTNNRCYCRDEIC
ncbi:hypothetical protein Hanom_Chr15g01381861 [Helianthus anomalus]